MSIICQSCEEEKEEMRKQLGEARAEVAEIKKCFRNPGDHVLYPLSVVNQLEEDYKARIERLTTQLTLCRVALERIANDYEPVTKDGLLWPNIDPREVAKEALNSLTSKTQGESDAT